MSVRYISTRLQTSFRIESVVSIHYFEYPTDFHYPGESHDFWELIYCDKGDLQLTVDDRQLRLPCGKAFLHPPGQFHNVCVYGQRAANSVIVSFYSDASELFQLANSVIEADAYAADALFAILREAKATFQNPLGQVYDAQLRRKTSVELFASEQVIQNYLELLMIHLIRQNNLPHPFPKISSRQQKNPLLDEITHYMKENLGEKLTFSTLATQFSVSPTTLKALFRRNFDMGTMEYLNFLRIERAKELLRNNSLSCTEIALQCGFCSVHHFSSAFKRACGMSPLSYTKSIKGMLESATEG